jgi:hypothetical protein
LSRDASAIIASAKRATSDTALRDVAELAGESIREALARASGPTQLKRVIGHFRMLHAEARRANRQAELTAYTLVIIYLSALALPDPGRAAVATIDAFISEHGVALPPARGGSAQG